MKHSLLIALLAGITTTASPLMAQDEGGQPPARRAPSPLKAEMESLETAVDAVVAFLKEPEGDAPLAEVAAAQVALQKAKQMTPSTTERQPAEKQAEFVTDYKIQINKTIRGVLDLEDALLQKDWEAAGKAVDELDKLQKAGHDKFKGKRRRGSRGQGGDR